MDKVIKDVLNQIIKFNDFLEKKPFTKNKIKEEKENIKEFFNTQQRLKHLLTILDNTPVTDINKNNENLMELHVLMDNMSWFFQNMHQQVITILKNYPDPD